MTNAGSQRGADGSDRDGARASVRDTRFGSGPPLTLGVEEEFMLVDAGSLGLAGRIGDVLTLLPEEEGWSQHVMPELFESTVEAATGICGTVDDALRELTQLRRGLSEVLQPLGLRLAAGGTHPFSLSEDQRITPRARYREVIEQQPYVARREVVFGMHVHVAVPDAETCMRVMEGVLVELPLLLALSADSPFWRGRATGLVSTRSAVGAGSPRTGPPPRFESYEDYAEMVSLLEANGSISDYTQLWWSVRPHPRLGTIELRVPDAQFDLEYSLALAAYAQALVAELIDEIGHGQTPPSYHRLLVAENTWAAARHGLDTPMLDLSAGGREKVGARTLVERRLERLGPYAKDLGSLDALRGIERILRDGTGAARQLRVWTANQDLHEVLTDVCDVTELAAGSHTLRISK